MLLNDLLKQDDSKKVVEDAKFIEFSKRTVRFGDSLYQLRNVTGFEVGKIPKDKFPTLIVLGMLLAGTALLVVGIGIILIGIAGWMIFSHFTQPQKYGFILTLNSGESISFISRDKLFLGNIVSALYQLMEGEIDGVTINFQDRSVNIHAPFKGIAATGDNPQNEYKA
ncbi:MAG: hypothetical protein JGK24_20420 [Microcoleus sp. PH2017_29_MFU_D_A]|uniref:DUF6232 family protein n=1 Tax=unclassified Microcoleus TaxID=2642155 RepID=UPI001D246CDD|nr:MULTISPECIES: DUF6232 family protein [unclassified Microcoleus]MCC3433458.1 hypothetical protein [Microcoleus sp. PH2017_04_SCI_O_A]TAG61345.1 MAG: hypothetical protein EAZ25_31430 [Oscillatoriales cyanobacterium]MCC3414951.1 hypothetical protein [Microcoleus sp. PH2017_02_FOX_O_A]MCC3427256.1 hypothetical protein [Microcoleus sp. PH2017_01_SCD_O_A]MCC3519079.1 hypothetical protein [Microcoleus sp. PH2017_18_LLB_O_A]